MPNWAPSAAPPGVPLEVELLRRAELGESLSTMTDHYLLMTATPHKGDPDNFCLFLELLDRNINGGVKSTA
jgi:hypothetical protein